MSQQCSRRLTVYSTTASYEVVCQVGEHQHTGWHVNVHHVKFAHTHEV